MYEKLFRQQFIKIHFSLFLFLYSYSIAFAGLIVEILPGINTSGIRRISSNGDKLIVEYQGGQRILQLPANALDGVVLWAYQECIGAFVFSVDGALVPNAPDYMAPCLPPHLGEAMLRYDVYAHSLAQGKFPEDTLSHPLVKTKGNTLSLPYRQYRKLMSMDNQSAEALWFRHLTARYPSFPGCIGEFTIKATPSSKGFPVKIEVGSHRWIRPLLWYREKSVPNEQEHLALSLPYRALDEDIEKRFDEYRKVFKPLNELASIVEAYAILNQLALTNKTLWNNFIKARYGTLMEEGEEISTKNIAVSYEPDLSSPSFSSDVSWSAWTESTIGETIETSTEADAAISLLWDDWGDNYYQSEWEDGIEEIGKSNTDIKCKWLLYKALNNDDTDILEKNARLFFTYAKSSMQHFRLRVIGYKKIREQESDESSDTFASLLDAEKEAIIRDYIKEVDRLKNTKLLDNFITWEDLSQAVYSVGLLDLFLDDEWSDEIDAEFAKRLAYVHYRRGMADQKSLSLAYTHAHFRFLKYLADLSAWDEDLTADIQKYRSELASKMGLIGWDEDSFNYEENYGYSWEEEDQDENPSYWTNFPVVEGTLKPANSLFDNPAKKGNTLNDGSPVGLYTPAGKFMLLLVDSRTFIKSFGKAFAKWPSSIKVYGIQHHKGKSITPLRLEYMLDGEWVVLDLPNSGISESGVLSGDR